MTVIARQTRETKLVAGKSYTVKEQKGGFYLLEELPDELFLMDRF